MSSLPWKKMKSGPISRLMSEIQQSPKRGGSLVIETGFPTSLIDIFFKNRDRLKKSSSKRLQRIQQQTQTAPNGSSLINQEKPARKEEVRSKIEKVNFVGGRLAAGNKHATDKSVCVNNSGGSGACVLFAFMVFIVALLALSTKKKLTIGITISAFALLLTELVAARVFTHSKLCNTNKGKRIETFADSKGCPGEEIRVPKSISCLEKTKTVVAVTKNPNLKALTIRDLLLKDEKSKSKSSRLKSKIVKKLRSCTKIKKTMKKIKEDSLWEVSSLVSEDKSEKIESERDEKAESNRPLIVSNGYTMNGTVLTVIVLTGLLSGKILAIVLTLTCLVLRFRAAKILDQYI